MDFLAQSTSNVGISKLVFDGKLISILIPRDYTFDIRLISFTTGFVESASRSVQHNVVQNTKASPTEISTSRMVCILAIAENGATRRDSAFIMNDEK